MGKLNDRLQRQLKTEHKQDAEDCIKIYNRLKEMYDGHVWGSNWNPLVSTIFKGFPSDERRFKPTAIGYIFLKGLGDNQNKAMTHQQLIDFWKKRVYDLKQNIHFSSSEYQKRKYRTLESQANEIYMQLCAMKREDSVTINSIM